MSERKQIGTYTLREEQLVTYAGFETAAWWEKRRLIPGTYPVTEYHGRMIVSIPAVVVESYFGPNWGDTKREAGSETRHCLDVYDYLVAEDMVSNPNTGWDIPGRVPVPHEFDSKSWDDDSKTYVPCRRTMYLLKSQEGGAS